MKPNWRKLIPPMTSISVLGIVTGWLMTFLIYRVHENIPKYYEVVRILIIVSIVVLLLIAFFLIKKGMKKE